MKKEFQRIADELLLSKYVPAGVMVNDFFDIVDFRGYTGFYIEPSPGIASLNVLKMVRKGLYHDLQEALAKAKTEMVEVKRNNIALEHEGRLLRINIIVHPLMVAKEKFFMVVFNDLTPPASTDVENSDGINDSRDLRILQLEQELPQGREQMRALGEAQEATSEEFQSANEELKTLKEELQASQEELVSVNDELVVRNKELNDLNQELSETKQYTESINNTVNDSLLVLDSYLRVRSANQSFYDTFKTIKAETEGKLVYELGNGQWNIPSLRQLLEEILPQRNNFSDFFVSHHFGDIGERIVKLNARKLKGGKEDLILLAIEDITSSKKMADELKEKQAVININEERQRLAIEATNMGTWDYIMETDTLFFSEKAMQVFGFDHAEYKGLHHIFENIHPDDITSVQKEMTEKMYSDTGKVNISYRLIKDEAICWISNVGKALLDENRKLSRFTGVVTDIAEQKNLQSSLEETVMRLNFAFDTAKIGSWELQLPERKMVCSAQTKINFGVPEDASFTFEDLMGKILQEDRHIIEEAMDNAVSTKKLYQVQYRVTWADGSIHWIAATGMARYDADDNPTNMVGISVDVTERKAVEEKLEYSERHFRTLANSSPVLICMSSGDDSFNFFNKQWLQFTGTHEGQLNGTKWFNFLQPDDLASFKKMYENAKKKYARFNTEFRMLTNGRYRWLGCIAVPRFTLDNKFDGYTMACIDVHAQKMQSEELEKKVGERTEALRDLNDDLQDRNRELEQFAYVTSHDLQEPLRKIKMFTSMLIQREDGENRPLMDYLHRIEHSAGRMIGLIQDLLNYSNLQEKTHDFVPVDLNKVAQNIMVDFDLLIEEKSAIITIGTLPFVDAVPLQMNQLFYNLISNALKFSKKETPPHISIAATLLEKDEYKHYWLKDNHQYCRINITDDGIGFSADYNERIFEIFQRLHHRDQFKGNGIGLALCKRIMNNHGGAILPHSEEGRGATFEIIIPLKQ